MKILLIPSPLLEDNIPTPYLPLGLVCLATVLRNGGFDVEILDINSIASDISYKEVPEAIIARDPDVVGFHTMFGGYSTVLRIARSCQELKPDIKILLGGPQATITDRATMEAFPEVDVIVRGEAEQTIISIIENIQKREGLHKIPGLTFRDGGRVITTSPSLPIRDLDSLPDPDYNLFPSMGSLKEVGLELGRGCPYKCIFCSPKEFWQSRVRYRSIVSLIRTIKKLVPDYGNKEFVFMDDNLTISRSKILQVCNALEKEELDIRWACSCRADSLDGELLRRMARAGCIGMYFGIETGSVRMQKIIRKRLKLDRTVKIMRQVAEQNIFFMASFITGFPQEQIDDLVQTIHLVMTLQFMSARFKSRTIQFHLLAPLPGTMLFKKYGKGLFYDANFPAVAKSQLTNEDLKLIKGYSDIFSAFYYYPTPYIERGAIVRIVYLMKNLIDRLHYTAFVLWKDKRLGFPKCIFDYHSLLNLPDNHWHKSTNLDDLIRVCDFLKDILYQAGFKDHFIHDVMKYELAKRKISLDDPVKCSIQLEKFNYDILELIKEIKSNGFQRLPRTVRKIDNILVFMKKDNRIVVKSAHNEITTE